MLVRKTRTLVMRCTAVLLANHFFVEEHRRLIRLFDGVVPFDPDTGLADGKRHKEYRLSLVSHEHASFRLIGNGDCLLPVSLSFELVQDTIRQVSPRNLVGMVQLARRSHAVLAGSLSVEQPGRTYNRPG